MASDVDYALVQIFDPWDILVPDESVAKISTFDAKTRVVTNSDACTDITCKI